MKAFIAVLVLVFMLLQIRLWVGDGGVMKILSLQKEVKVQQAQVDVLEDRNDKLLAEIQDLKNRLDALEERARTDLGMVRQNETFYQDAS